MVIDAEVEEWERRTASLCQEQQVAARFSNPSRRKQCLGYRQNADRPRHRQMALVHRDELATRQLSREEFHLTLGITLRRYTSMQRMARRGTGISITSFYRARKQLRTLLESECAYY